MTRDAHANNKVRANEPIVYRHFQDTAAHVRCHYLETTTDWLLQRQDYCIVLDIATPWILPLTGSCHFLGIATSWVLPHPGDACDTNMLDTSRPCVSTSYELRSDDVLS